MRKHSLLFRLFCVLSFVVSLFSMSFGFSDYVISKSTYDETGTLSSQAKQANESGDKVTVTLKYQTIEGKSAPDFSECFDENNQTFGTASNKIKTNNADKYNRLKDFLSSHIKDSPFSSDNLGVGMYRRFGKENDAKYSNIEFELNVTKNVEKKKGFLGLTTNYSGEYYMLARDYTKTIYKTSNLNTSSQISVSRNTRIDFAYLKNNLRNPDSTKYEFCGLKEVVSDGSVGETYFDMSKPITSNITLCAVFQNKKESSLELSEITSTINSASNTTLQFYKGASSGRDISRDPGYNEKESVVYLGTGTIETTVKFGVTVIFALNDESTNSEYQRTNKISFEPENSEHDRQYTVALANDLTIDGELDIGGEYGIKENSLELQGNINNRYVCLDLNGHNITINKGGVLNSYGLIKDSTGVGKIIVNGGKVYTLATVADYRSGNFTVDAISKKVFPFNLYALPYLRCKLIFNYSTANGWGELIAGAHITLGKIATYHSITIDLKILGPGSSSSNPYLFSCGNGIDGGSKVILDTYDYSVGKTMNSMEFNKLKNYCFNQKMKVDVYSTDIFLGYIDISVTFGVPYSVNTKDLVFPISSFFEICMFSSSLTIKQRMQFSCGSSLIFDKDSKMIFDYSGDYSGNLSLLDIPPFYWDNRTNKLIDNSVATSFLQRDNFYRVAAYWKYYSMPKMRIYGKLLFRKGNKTSYQIAGTLNFDEDNIGTIDSKGNVSLFKDSGFNDCFTMLKQNNVKITTYGLDFLNLSNNKEKHTAGYSRPLISNGMAYVFDDNHNMSGTFDYKSGIFTDGSTSKKYVINNDVSKKFSLQDAGSANIDECSYDEKTHIITSNGKQYVYVSNICAEYNATAGTADFSRLGLGSVAVKYNVEQNRWLRG